MTASIYPILNEQTKENVIEPLPDTDLHEGGRVIKKYILTPFGIRVAEKVEEARKEFVRAFIAARAKSLHLPLSRLKKEFSDAELSEILDNMDLDALKSSQNHLQMKIKDMGNTLTLLNSHIEIKMKNTRR